MSPPEREKRPSAEALSLNHSSENQSTATGRQAIHDALAAIRRRPYKPSTGLYARGYHDGYGKCFLWAQDAFHEHLDEVGRAKLATIVARSDIDEIDEIFSTASDVERGKDLCR